MAHLMYLLILIANLCLAKINGESLSPEKSPNLTDESKNTHEIINNVSISKSEVPFCSKEILKNAAGFLIDLDGTIYTGGGPIKSKSNQNVGYIFLKWLEDKKLPYVILTNSFRSARCVSYNLLSIFNKSSNEANKVENNTWNSNRHENIQKDNYVVESVQGELINTRKKLDKFVETAGQSITSKDSNKFREATERLAFLSKLASEEWLSNHVWSASMAAVSLLQKEYSNRPVKLYMLVTTYNCNVPKEIQEQLNILTEDQSELYDNAMQVLFDTVPESARREWVVRMDLDDEEILSWATAAQRGEEVVVVACINTFLRDILGGTKDILDAEGNIKAAYAHLVDQVHGSRRAAYTNIEHSILQRVTMLLRNGARLLIGSRDRILFKKPILTSHKTNLQESGDNNRHTELSIDTCVVSNGGIDMLWRVAAEFDRMPPNIVPYACTGKGCFQGIYHMLAPALYYLNIQAATNDSNLFSDPKSIYRTLLEFGEQPKQLSNFNEPEENSTQFLNSDLSVSKPSTFPSWGFPKHGREQWEAARTLLPSGIFNMQDIYIVGDNLESDMLAANMAGLSSIFVLSGYHKYKDILALNPENRPTCYVSTVADIVDIFLQ